MRDSVVVAVVVCTIAIFLGALALSYALLFEYPATVGSSFLGTSLFMVPGIVSVALGAVGLGLLWAARNFAKRWPIHIGIAAFVSIVILVAFSLWWYVLGSGVGATWIPSVVWRRGKRVRLLTQNP